MIHPTQYYPSATRILACCAIGIWLATSSAIAVGQEETQNSAGTQDNAGDAGPGMDVETIVDGLKHPCGVAVQPDSGAIFVSDSGNGRVIRLNDGSVEAVVSGYPVEPLADDFGFSAGPLGIGFLSARKLVVSSGCWKAGMDRVSIFDLAKAPMTADDEEFSRSLNSTGTTPAEGDYYGLVVDGQHIFVSCRGDVNAGWVGLFSIRNDKPGPFKRHINTIETAGTQLPTTVTISPDGNLLVGLRGNDGDPSTLAFYDPGTGEPRAKFDTTINGLVALAYAPRSGRLFALYNSRATPGDNGLYKLVGRRRNTECEARLIKKLDQPSSMTFTPGGDLLITAGGEDGVLLKIAGLDQPAAAANQTPKQTP